MELQPSIPLICVCGNHDVGNVPTPDTLTEYRKDFGDDYMAFWVKGVKFLVINSQLYSDSSMCEMEADKHDRWLMDQLNNEENKHAKHIMVFQVTILVTRRTTVEMSLMMSAYPLVYQTHR